MKKKKRIINFLIYFMLGTLSIIWIFPVFWIVMTSFRVEQQAYIPYFWPTGFSFNNYQKLFWDTRQFFFVKWFINTLLVATGTCILSTFYVLCVSFTFSRMRFHQRKPMMNIALILNMFPGFMSMIAVYYILKGFGISQSLLSLVFVYSTGAALSYHIAKGFFDTIPKAIDEAAWIDGATKWKVFTQITIPLSRPIIIYTVLTSFMGPWVDFIFAKVILGTNYQKYTVAIGLWTMLQKEYISTWYTRFAAGAVVVSIPVVILFFALEKYYAEGLSGSIKG